MEAVIIEEGGVVHTVLPGRPSNSTQAAKDSLHGKLTNSSVVAIRPLPGAALCSKLLASYVAAPHTHTQHSRLHIWLSVALSQHDAAAMYTAENHLHTLGALHIARWQACELTAWHSTACTAE